MTRLDWPKEGRPHPLGATFLGCGVNFSVYSRSAGNVELLLFGSKTRVLPMRRAYHYWHAYECDVEPGQLYAYRVDGGPELLDPYSRAVHDMKSVVADRRGYDWEGDHPLRRPWANTVIYEMHLAGFTKNPNSGVSENLRGTYLGAIEKIDYLRQLGITAVELMPIFQFDRSDAPSGVNYWGYSPMSFFAPHRGYASASDPLAALREFRQLVKAFHLAGIEVILDVVYNHTAEGGDDGKVFCFKGLDPATYYLRQDGRYLNYTGCGNTVNGNNAVVRRLIRDSLRFWVQECHVDGFRFDLASVLARDEKGRPLPDPPILWDIESDPVLAGTKLIAEAWDAAGLYQVGSFIGDSWMEWNGRFRDDVRGFMKGDNGLVKSVAQRLLASPDLFAHEGREAEQSINFITCHDGFTLNDLVSYNGKHNLANGEDNRDGSNDNRSWNCGVEGPSDDPEVESLRLRQIKNFLVFTLLSLGTPMLLMGDEVRRTQLGNNNAYCQDNELSWFDWSLVEENAGLLRFTRQLIRYRTERDPAIGEGLSLSELLAQARVEFHGIELQRPDWSDSSHTLAFTAHLPGDRRLLHGLFNAYWEPLVFQLPAGGWRTWLDTARESPGDVYDWRKGPRVESGVYVVEPRSIVILFRAIG